MQEIESQLTQTREFMLNSKKRKKGLISEFNKHVGTTKLNLNKDQTRRRSLNNTNVSINHNSTPTIRD